MPFIHCNHAIYSNLVPRLSIFNPFISPDEIFNKMKTFFFYRMKTIIIKITRSLFSCNEDLHIGKSKNRKLFNASPFFCMQKSPVLLIFHNLFHIFFFFFSSSTGEEWARWRKSQRKRLKSVYSYEVFFSLCFSVIRDRLQERVEQWKLQLWVDEFSCNSFSFAFNSSSSSFACFLLPKPRCA